MRLTRASTISMPKTVGHWLDPRQHRRRQAAARLGDDLGHRQLRVDGLQFTAHGIAQAGNDGLLIARPGTQVGTRVAHSPAQVDVDDQSLLFAGQEGFALQALPQHPAIDAFNVLERPAPVQARRVAVLLHLPKARAHRKLGLADGKQAERQQYQQPGHSRRAAQ